MSDSSDWTPNFAAVTTPAPTWPARRPVRIALLGDFGGGALAGRLDDSAKLGKRKPLKVEFDTLEDALGRLELKLTLPIGAGGAAVEVPITELESFHPDELYRNLEVFSALSGLRKRLNTPATFAKAAAEVQSLGGGGQRKASSISRSRRARGAALAGGAKLDDFARLTGRPAATAGPDDSLDSLLRSIVGPFVVPAPNPQKDAMVATVDNALSDAMRAVLHQPDFQNAESLWRGVDFLLRRLETSHQLQVHLFDITAEELAADLSGHEDLAETGLYKLLVDTPSQDPDGGYSYLAGCYHFEAAPPQAELLGRIANVAAHAGAPFITAIATDPFTDRREPPHRLVRQAFEALQQMPNASYLGLIGPRFLLRHPYGKRSDPIQSFSFEEFTPSAGLHGMLWGHPALLALAVLGVRGGQLTLDDLPFHHFVDADGDSVALPCTERLINTNAATLLRDFGINGVMAHKGEPLVRLAGLQAINGDGLAASTSAPRKAASSARFVIQGKVDKSQGGVGAAGAVEVRRAAGPAATAPAAAAPLAEEAAEETAAASEIEAETESEAAPATAAAEADASEVDSELEALLASLGGSDDAPAASETETSAEAAPEAAAEEEMDPELAALLKSLG